VTQSNPHHIIMTVAMPNGLRREKEKTHLERSFSLDYHGYHPVKRLKKK